MPLSLVQRLLHTLTPHPLPLESAGRAEVPPPMARDRTPPWRRRFAAWLGSGLSDASVSTAFGVWSPPPPRQATALSEARAAFREALEDLAMPETGITLEHIRCARSLHELWHLRAEVFNLIACLRSQREADLRLAVVDRHFSSRTRRQARSARDGQESVPPI